MLYLMAASIGISLMSSIASHEQQKEQNRIANKAASQQAEEIARQRKREADRQRRENEELMNSVSNMTNVAWSGASSPTLNFDKYGDLG